MTKTIDKIELRFLQIADYESLKTLMQESYSGMKDSYWPEETIATLIEKFPDGQVAITVNDEVVGCALSIIVNYQKFGDNHTYPQICGDNYSFDTHDDDGDVLYGIDVFIKSSYRGMRLGRRIYDYRKELCENLNLKAIIFGGRLPNYHLHAKELSTKEYIQEVKLKKIYDPVLTFQLSNDFHVKKVMRGYLPGDKASKDYACLLQWDNIYYEAPSTSTPVSQKEYVRVGLVQWQMRPYNSLEELVEQAEYFIDAVSGYRCDFVLFPELFNAPLMAAYNKFSESEAIRLLADFSIPIRDRFQELAISYNINIITGSMPHVEDDILYNIGYLCKRNGESERFVKLHPTPDEVKVWGMSGGNELKTYDTDCGKIGILICYDVEFPELSRILAEQGMNILFVPFLTDTQNGYSRVRHCAQARAIENECYVALAGSVGNLPKVHNMDIQFSQSVVFTPCDFAFPTTGIKEEATPNTEMILISDLDLELLKELHRNGSVQNLRDRRKDLYEVRWRKRSTE
jgi:predicted amidohydrolase